MHTDLVLLHLSLLEGVGPATVATLLHHNKDLTLLYDCSESDLVAYWGLAPSGARKVYQGLKELSLLDDELARIERYQVQWATNLSSAYPALLKNIYLPPVVLYWRGTLPKNERLLAVVGSRKASRYGQMAIERIIPDLVEQGIGIVSGGALGADSMAHAAALDAGGMTVAVIGSGLIDPYPASNKKLFERMIAEGSAVISPFPLATQAYPGNFPARNRIIAGMSTACLVIQAAAKSGALITAQYVLEQGKDVMAIPGMINDPLSEGCHDLIRDGAFLAANARDVLALFGEFSDMPVAGSIVPSDESQQLSLAESVVGGVAASVLHACVQPRAIEDLADELRMPLEVIMQELFALQLAGKVQQNFAGLWQAT